MPSEPVMRLKMRAVNHRAFTHNELVAGVKVGEGEIGMWVELMNSGLVEKLPSCCEIWMRICTESFSESCPRSLIASTMNAVKTAEKRPAYVALDGHFRVRIDVLLTKTRRVSIFSLLVADWLSSNFWRTVES